jgi:hypothetical protein
MEKQRLTTTLDPETSHCAANIEELVKGRLNGRVWAFQLIVESQGLVLRGRCRTYYAKQLAQHLVMEIGTVHILANDIEVVIGGEP